MYKHIYFFVSLPFPYIPLHPPHFSFSLSFVSSLASGWPRTHRIYHVTKNDFELLVFLPPPPKCCIVDLYHILHLLNTGIKPRASCILNKQSTNRMVFLS